MVYEKAQTIAPLQQDVEQLVAIVLARAGFEKRRIDASKSGGFRPHSAFMKAD